MLELAQMLERDRRYFALAWPPAAASSGWTVGGGLRARPALLPCRPVPAVGRRVDGGLCA